MIRKNQGERFESFELLAEAEILWTRRFGTVYIVGHELSNQQILRTFCNCEKRYHYPRVDMESSVEPVERWGVVVVLLVVRD